MLGSYQTICAYLTRRPSNIHGAMHGAADKPRWTAPVRTCVGVKAIFGTKLMLDTRCILALTPCPSDVWVSGIRALITAVLAIFNQVE